MSNFKSEITYQMMLDHIIPPYKPPHNPSYREARVGCATLALFGSFFGAALSPWILCVGLTLFGVLLIRAFYVVNLAKQQYTEYNQLYQKTTKEAHKLLRQSQVNTSQKISLRKNVSRLLVLGSYEPEEQSSFFVFFWW